jgi:hypothetical protein
MLAANFRRFYDPKNRRKGFQPAVIRRIRKPPQILYSGRFLSVSGPFWPPQMTEILVVFVVPPLKQPIFIRVKGYSISNFGCDS